MRIPLILPGLGHSGYHAQHNIAYATSDLSEGLSSQQAINMYWTPGIGGDSGFWRPSPGTTTVGTAVGAAIIRGMHWSNQGDSLYVVSGNDVESWVGGSSDTDIGDLNTSTGSVRFAENSRTEELLIVDGTNGYILDTDATPTINAIADVDYIDTADVCAYIDGYFLVADSQATNSRFYWSNLNDGTAWESTDFATKEGGTDKLSDIVVSNRQIYLLGETTYEVWYNSGDPDQIFKRYQGGFQEIGVFAPHLAKAIGGYVYFPTRDERGTSSVVRANGSNYEVISNHYIDSSIQGMYSDADSFGFAFRIKGHDFYGFANPGAGEAPAFLYDITTGQWHQWAHYNGATFPANIIWSSIVFDGGGLSSQVDGIALGRHSTGTLYRMDFTGITCPNTGPSGDTSNLTRRLVGPAIYSEKPIRISEVTMEIGGDSAAGRPSSGNVTLYVSTDAGINWDSAGNPKVSTTQTAGAYRYSWHKFSASKSLRFRLDFDEDTQSEWGVLGLWGRVFGDDEVNIRYG